MDDVIIVGAGTVGLFTALGLARRGVRVRVFEAGTGDDTGARDTVYYWSALPDLEKLGVLEECSARAIRAEELTYEVPSTGERVEIPLSVLADEVPYPYLLYISQRDVRDVLVAQLAQYPHVQVHWNSRVSTVAHDAAGVTVVVEDGDGDESTYRGLWLVGADGVRSVVRHKLGLALAGFTWPHRFVATNLRYDFAAAGVPVSTVRIDPVAGALITRVDTHGLWRYVYAEHRTLPEESVSARASLVLRKATGQLDANVLGIEACYPYRIHERAAERFRVGRALLVGDAAHVTNSSLGLGLTSGLCDAFVLIDALAAVIVEGRNDSILDSYAHERLRNFHEVSSPLSSSMNQFLFPLGRLSAQQAQLEQLRAIASSRDAAREQLSRLSAVSSTTRAGADR